jgi:hypothetical protein
LINEITNSLKKNTSHLLQRIQKKYFNHTMEPERYRRLIACLTDPANGGSAESAAKLKEQMEKPEVACALSQQLMERDVSDFNVNDIAQLPPKLMETLKKHFPDNFAWHCHGTRMCTLRPDGGTFGVRSKLLDDARVLSLEQVGKQALKMFVENSVSVEASRFFHRKIYAVFLKAEDECTKIDLCDLFDWCKCSVMDKSSPTNIEETIGFTCMQTPFGRVFLTVHVLKNEDGCKMDFLNGDKTVQIQIKHKPNEPTTIGIGLHIAHCCKRCKKYSSDTVKLKGCKRCLAAGIKLFYCSRECQLLDYPNHRHVCTYDWSASDWRETAPV